MKTMFGLKQVARICGVTEAEVKKWTRKGGGLAQYGGKVARGTLIRFLKATGKSLGELALPVRVLLVGMSDSVKSELATLLSEDSATVQNVSDVASAEHLMQMATPDFILVDFSIGREVAFKFAERLRNDSALKEVFVYGFPGADDTKQEGLWGLFAEVRKKPVEHEELVHLIRLRTMQE